MTARLPDIFLSYGHNDVVTARRFADGLERAGFSVWWDATLHSGDSFDAAIEAALRGAKAVVVLWSAASVQSRWVRAEATLADRLNTLVPVMVESCERPIMFELTQTANLVHWSGNDDDPAWRSLVGDVRRLIEKAAVTFRKFNRNRNRGHFLLNTRTWWRAGSRHAADRQPIRPC